MEIDKRYDLWEKRSLADYKFLFVSRGVEDVAKAIQYAYTQTIDGIDVYNLGFGDYNADTQAISDDVNTNNGDAYKVFNTVLATIPIFFEKFISSLIVVRGSDSTPEFLKNCAMTCRKHCESECKKFNQRIRIYRNYIDKNYLTLSIEYQFYGGYVDENNQILIEEYSQHKTYDAILLSKVNR